jgi:hypothetical protein
MHGAPLDQLRNFEPSASRHTMLLFFLRLLNFGIPILLIGNPLGFKGFESFSQDTRRLYKGDSVELWPSDTSNGIAWKIFVAGKVKFSVLQNGLDLTDTVMDEIFRCTGGVHDYFDTLWYVMQVRAIKAKKEGLEFSDIGAAYRSMSMKRLRPMIDALVSKDALALMKFQDIPAEDFAKRWGVKLTPSSLPALANKKAVKNQLDAGAATDAGGLHKPSFEKNEEKFSAHQKRVERKHKVAKDFASTLSGKDLRTSANIEALLKGADQLRYMTGRK